MINLHTRIGVLKGTFTKLTQEKYIYHYTTNVIFSLETNLVPFKGMFYKFVLTYLSTIDAWDTFFLTIKLNHPNIRFIETLDKDIIFGI